jgi:hypothetical protein
MAERPASGSGAMAVTAEPSHDPGLSPPAHVLRVSLRDRTLPGRPGSAPPGCADAMPQVDEVPVGAYDVRLDAVATERGGLRSGGLNANPLPG